MQSLIKQSFEIFNIYGKEPEALTSIIQGFALILENESADDITKAFKEWLRISGNMPTPSDIYKICNEERKHREYVGSHAPRQPVKHETREFVRDRDRMTPEEWEAAKQRVSDIVEGAARGLKSG